MSSLRAFLSRRILTSPCDGPRRMLLERHSARVLSTRVAVGSSQQYAHSTMDLVNGNGAGGIWATTGSSSSQPSSSSSSSYVNAHICSTLQVDGSEHDFDPSLTGSTRNPIQYDFQTWNTLTDVLDSSKYHGRVVAVEMDLVQARSARHSFDKIVLLIHHGEEEEEESVKATTTTTTHATSPFPQDAKLSGRGVGQALSLSRRISAFCNSDTGLLPELFILAPLRQVMQTAMLALPHYSPFYSYQEIPWLCHSALASGRFEYSASNKQQQQPSVGSGETLSTAAAAAAEQHSLTCLANKDEWVQRTDAVLDMIREREEQVIVGTFVDCVLHCYGSILVGLQCVSRTLCSFFFSLHRFQLVASLWLRGTI